jgi:serine-type D-Ala-D-Ala carboxypeptidase (penicillin-binding protein 5/6)
MLVLNNIKNKFITKFSSLVNISVKILLVFCLLFSVGAGSYASENKPKSQNSKSQQLKAKDNKAPKKNANQKNAKQNQVKKTNAKKNSSKNSSVNKKSANNSDKKPTPKSKNKSRVKAPPVVPLADAPTEDDSPKTTGEFSVTSRQAFLLDYTTNTILYSKNGTQIIPPASLTKVLTAYVVFDYLHNKKLLPSTKLCTSKYASNRGGTSMNLKAGDCTELQYLMYGLLTMSGNDAAATIAEAIGGSEAGFSNIMNQYAKKLGMNSSHFANPSGLPNPDHRSTARDLVILAKRSIDDFPQYYQYFGRKVFEYNGIIQPNRNKLINEGLGVDGLKTGFTNKSGYGILVSAERNGRRIVGVVHGNNTAKQRLNEARRLVNYAYEDFEIVKLFEKNTIIDKMRVWGGDVDYVNLYSPVPIQFVVRKSTKQTAKYRSEIMFKEPWKAPLQAGTHAANLAIYENNKLRVTFPLYTAAEVKIGTFAENIVDKIKLITGEEKPKK